MKYMIQANKEETSFKLLDTKSNKVEIYSIDDILLNRDTIANIAIVDNKIKGTNGNIERYKENRLVILFEVVEAKSKNTIYYNVSDSNGNIKNMQVKEIIEVTEKLGIANGKLVKKDGKEFISSIQGEYPKILIEEAYKNTVDLDNRLRYIIIGIRNHILMSLNYKCTYKKLYMKNVGIGIKVEKSGTIGHLEIDLIDTGEAIAVTKENKLLLSIKTENNINKEDLKAIGMDIVTLILLVNNHKREEVLAEIKKKSSQIGFKYIKVNGIEQVIDSLYIQ